MLASGRKLNEDRHYIQLVGRYYVLNFIALKESVRNLRQQARGCVSALSVITNFFLGQDMIATGLGIAGYGTKKGEVKQDQRAMKRR